MGHKWVICGSHPDCSECGSVGHVVNKCDPLSTQYFEKYQFYKLGGLKLFKA